MMREVKLARRPLPVAARYEYMRSIGWSLSGSTGRLSLIDIAQDTIITARTRRNSPRAILPSIAPAP
jgi:hypothetical protein